MNPINKTRSINLQKGFAILVIVGLLGGFWFYLSMSLKGPQPYYRDYDPEMAYFLNSLAVFKESPYFYTDHPGTPVEIIGSIVLGITYLFFDHQSSFINYHLQNPQLFLNISHGVVTLLSILCAVYFFLTASRALRWAGVYLALALALLFYGLHPYSFTTLTVWSHTSFNFPLGAAYLVLLFKIAHDNQGRISNKLAAGLGFALGIMMAFMINFVPWLVTTLVFIVLSGRFNDVPWKITLLTAGIVLLSCAAGFLLSVLPALYRLSYFLGFIRNLFSHQLPYGNGPQGITSIPLLWNNLREMVSAAPVLFFTMVACLAISLLVFRRRDSHSDANRSMWALNFALLLQCIIISIAVMKHPGERFLLPLAATIPVLLLVIVKLTDSNRRLNQQLGLSLLFFTVISISAFAFLSIRNRNAELVETRTVEAEIDRALDEQQLYKKTGDPIILRTNATYSYCSALLYGDSFTSGVFAAEVNALCPSQVYLFYHSNWVLYRGVQVMIDELPWDILITRTSALASNPTWKEKGRVYEYPFDISLVVKQGQ
jgi:hypothetical protein